VPMKWHRLVTRLVRGPRRVAAPAGIKAAL
jgi:hypothetical protein